MSRTTSVHFSPPVGCRINLLDSASGKTVTASTLSIRDNTPFKHRTVKGTPRGQEYFYVKIFNGTKWDYIKMMNSLLLPNCISEDRKYIFKGELPNGGRLVGGVKKELHRIIGEKKEIRTSIKTMQSFSNDSLLNSI